MGKLIYKGSNPKWFQENMGRGGAIPLGKGYTTERIKLQTNQMTGGTDDEEIREYIRHTGGADQLPE